MTTPSKESKEIPIPEEFLKWMNQHLPINNSEYMIQYQDGYADGFNNASVLAFRHLHSQSVERMWWVKASERLPNKDEVGEIVHIKPIKKRFEFYMFIKYVRDWDIRDMPTFRWNLWDGYHGWTLKITPELLSQIEWLEEINS
jgi:hypothetical protein